VDRSGSGSTMRASLVIPTLNESASIGHVIRTFRDAAASANASLFRDGPIDWEIVVVDGASTDGTAAIAAAEGARVIVERRRGYGRAYKTGFAATSGEVIATADGDATYPVETIPTLVRRLLDDGLDFLTGNRMAYLNRTAMTTEHRIGNRVLNLGFGLLFHRWARPIAGGRLVDSQSGFWVFRRSVLDRVHLEEDGMTFSEELKIEVLLRGLRLAEVPIRYGERWGPPKLESWRDGLSNVVYLARKRLAVQRERPERVPVPFTHRPVGARPPP
jgi:dolichol-phosphate hexosyltransferase